MVFTVLETFTRPQLKEAWGQQLNHTQCSTHETLSKDEFPSYKKRLISG